MEDLPPFTYKPLPPGYIRLLVPSPFEQPDGRSWLLQTVRLDSSGVTYEALSYVWGSQNKTYPIICNGRSLRVHHNLYTALPYLARRPDGGEEAIMPIWIDAVCINQGDQEEKMVQIRLMNQVYRRARKVWVWLGLAEHPERIPDAVRLFTLIAEKEGKKSNSLSKSEIGDLVARSGLSLEDLTLKSTIVHLMDNAWFRRLWVIQEAALAQDLCFLCGDFDIQPHIIQKTALNVYKFFFWMGVDTRVPAQTGMLCMILEWFEKSTNVQNDHFSSVLTRVSHLMADGFECLQPEDRVLGILGMFEQRQLEGTILDPRLEYVSVQDLYVRHSTYILTQGDANSEEWWAWLSLAFTVRKIEGLPSWVPDLHHQSSIFKPVELKTYDYQAATSKPNKPRYSPKSAQLVLRGRAFDEVDCVYPEIPNDESYPESFLVRFACWEQTLAEAVIASDLKERDVVAGTRPGKKISPDTYWRTLYGDDTRLLEEVVTYYNFRIAIQPLHKLAKQYGIVDKLVKGVPDSDLGITDAEASMLWDTHPIELEVIAYIGAMSILRHRQLFLTKDGRFGFTVKGVRSGDVVVALNGSKWLHVLRKVSVGSDTEPATWKFVGDAYVHGVMYGEVDELGIEEEDIVLV